MLGAWMNLEDLTLSEISQTLYEVPGLPWWLSGKEAACQCRRLAFNPWVGKIPWRRAWQPTPVFLPGESQGQRSLADWGPWGRKELDTTKHSQFNIEQELYI